MKASLGEALAGAGVGATIQVVLQNLLSGSIEKIKQVWDLEEDLTDLVDSLFMVQDFLSDAEMKQINSKAVQHWLNQLEDVAFEADAVLDEFNYKLLRQEVEKQKQHDATNVFTDFFISGPTNLLLRNEMANKVNKLNERLMKINEKAEKYGLNRAVVEASSNVGLVMPQVQTDSISEVPKFIGRNEDVSKIVDMLISAPCDVPFSVIPILGMGGIGKTTLVQKVFSHERLRDHFDEKIWVCVSVDFDVMSLLKMILEVLTGKPALDFQRKEVVLDKIRNNLAGKKKYLLVLDDVWTESSNEWSAFMSSLLGTRSVDGNCIVVTTRKETVASNVGTFPAYWLSSMEEDDCWLIIKAITYSNVDVPREYEEIGKCIAQRCVGLPLAANVVGGLLRNKSKVEWELRKTQIMQFGIDDDYVMKILKLSYDHLPSSSSKKCFAYCSVFPQDYILEREELIMLWMAEGFLHDERRNDLENVGDIIFNHIFQSSLFHDAERDEYGNIEYCRMHDLVHDLARSISGDRTICTEDNRSNIVNRVRYFSLKADTKDSCAMLKKQGEYMRTIFIEGNIAVNMFAGFKRLHALKLTCSDMQELPNAIGELIHLRLFIIETPIKTLPDSVGKLYNLQTLWIEDHGRKFPNTIIDLVSLRNLRIPDWTQIPPGIGRLTSLQTLPLYHVGYESGRGIGELGNLKNLRGKLMIENLERVKSKEDAMEADLIKKSNIFDLSLGWNESTGGERSDESVLDGLQPHPNLKRLEIYGYSGKNFPEWTMRMASQFQIDSPWEELKKLTRITLSSCSQCVQIPTFGHLPCLKFLELEYMPNLTEWLDVDLPIAFPCLENLKIKHCPKLKTVPIHFPRLTELKVNASGLICLPGELLVKNRNLTCVEIESCPNFSCLVLGSLGGGSSLKILKIIECENLTELLEDLVNLHFLEELVIKSCPKFTCLASGLPSLKKLQIIKCEHLKDLSVDHSVEILMIERCDELKSITYVGGGSQGLSSLLELRIWNCSGLIELPNELLESCISSLKSLALYGLKNLETLDMPIPWLSKMSNLLELVVLGIPKLVISPTVLCLKSLKKLWIGGFTESMTLVSFNDILHNLLHENHSLEHLYLYGKEEWEFLPDQIQHLTTLKRLDLYYFGIEALPECLGNMSSLVLLFIQNCKRLKEMPSKEAMQRLTKLSLLEIWECPLLEESFIPKETSLEWSKISHLKRISVNGVGCE